MKLEAIIVNTANKIATASIIRIGRKEFKKTPSIFIILYYDMKYII
jgi:hypothetical protein